jgi:hypothetical protein
VIIRKIPQVIEIALQLKFESVDASFEGDFE